MILNEDLLEVQKASKFFTYGVGREENNGRPWSLQGAK